jgi:hypothetical protein
VGWKTTRFLEDRLGRPLRPRRAGVVYRGRSPDLDERPRSGGNDVTTRHGADVLSAAIKGADPFEESVAETIQRLAAVSALEYDRVRHAEANRLNIRVTTLDSEVAKARPSDSSAETGGGRTLRLPEPDPWPEPVDGATLLNELAGAFTRYLALPDHADAALALWVLHAHAVEASMITPRLALVSPTKRCGKTTCLHILGALVPRPLQASNITAAAMFRTVEAVQPTLLIDEADSFLAASDELRGIINAGHMRGGGVVRTVGDDHEPRAFSAWTATVIAAIGKLPDTIADRAVIVPMRRRRTDETLDRLRLDRLDALHPLARRGARWANDHAITIVDADPPVPSALNDRAADNWRPLLAIADAAGGEWPEQARAAALALSSDAEASDEAAGVMLLADLRTLFAERRVDRLASAKIVEALHVLEHRPWAEWRHGRPLSSTSLARLLKPFKITPRQFWDSEANIRGYLVSQFDEAFTRYLPDPTAETLDTSESAPFSDFQTARSPSSLATATAPNAKEAADSSGLAVDNAAGLTEGLI